MVLFEVITKSSYVRTLNHHKHHQHLPQGGGHASLNRSFSFASNVCLSWHCATSQRDCLYRSNKTANGQGFPLLTICFTSVFKIHLICKWFKWNASKQAFMTQNAQWTGTLNLHGPNKNCIPLHCTWLVSNSNPLNILLKSVLLELGRLFKNAPVPQQKTKMTKNKTKHVTLWSTNISLCSLRKISQISFRVPFFPAQLS